MRVVTWNLRTETAVDPPHWPDRLPDVAAVLTALEPDVIGTQEGSAGMLDELTAALGERWTWVGEGRRGGREDELTAVLVDSSRVELLAWRTSWLSETPDVPASSSWGSAFPRTATTVRLRDRADGTAYIVVNTHLDHVSERARREGASFVAAGVPGRRTVVVGDFNAPADPAHASGPYAVLTGAGLVDAVAWVDAGDTSVGTFPDFAAPVVGGDRIDWVLTSPDLEVGSARVVVDGPLGDALARGRHPSDHLPVAVDVTPAESVTAFGHP